VYGVNTGFGALAETRIHEGDIRALQVSLGCGRRTRWCERWWRSFTDGSGGGSVPNDWVNRLLELMRASNDKYRRVFVIGSFEHRVTIYSQQVRALNLVEALLRKGEIQTGDHVAVVGAGTAGLTFAAGAAHRGLRVTVLEREDDVLPLFRKRPKRWLHPYVYDWPSPGAEHARAGLPLLDWEAGLVESVLDQLETAWKERRAEAGDRIRVTPRASDIGVMPIEGAVQLSWNENEANGRAHPLTDRFSVVVLAVGFGLETSPLPGYRGYWDRDNLDFYDDFDPTKEPPREYLVSGCGDGALTDLLRLCIRDFRHHRVVTDFLSGPEIDAVKAEISSIEADPRAPGGSTSSFLHERYRELRVPSLVSKLEGRKRPDTRVTLNAEVPYFLQSNSSALNRFLVAHLLHVGQFRFIPGRVVDTQKIGDRVLVVFQDDTRKEFDRIVLRHGPKSALEEHFPAILKECTTLREMWRRAPLALDQTRMRYWDRGAFGPEERPAEALHSMPGMPPPIAPQARANAPSAAFIRSPRLEETVRVVEDRLGQGKRVVRLRGAPGDGKTQVGRLLEANRPNAVYIELPIPASADEVVDAEETWRQGLVWLAKKLRADCKTDEKLDRLRATVRDILTAMDPPPTVFVDNADCDTPFDLHDLLGGGATCVVIGSGTSDADDEVSLRRPTPEEFLQMVRDAALARSLSATDEHIVRRIGVHLDHAAIATGYVAGLVDSGVLDELLALERELDEARFKAKERVQVVFRKAWANLEEAARSVALLLGAFAEPEVPLDWIDERRRPSGTLTALIRSRLVERTPSAGGKTSLRAHRLVVQWLRAGSDPAYMGAVAETLRAWSVDEELDDSFKAGGPRKRAFNRAFELLSSRGAQALVSADELAFVQLTYIDQSGLHADGPETAPALERQLEHLAPDDVALTRLHPAVLGELLDALRAKIIAPSARLQAVCEQVIGLLERGAQAIEGRPGDEIGHLDVIAEHHWGKYLAHKSSATEGLVVLRRAEAHASDALARAQPRDRRLWLVRRAKTRVQIADALSDSGEAIQILRGEQQNEELPLYLRITIANRLLRSRGSSSPDEITAAARSALALCQGTLHEEVRADFLATATITARKHRLAELQDEVERFTRHRLDALLAGETASRRTQVATVFATTKAAEGRTDGDALLAMARAMRLMEMCLMPGDEYHGSRVLAMVRDAGAIAEAVAIADALRWDTRSDYFLLFDTAKTMRWAGRFDEAEAVLSKAEDPLLSPGDTRKVGNRCAIRDERAKIAARRGDRPAVERLLEENVKAYTEAGEPQFAEQCQRWLRALRERGTLEEEDAVLHDQWRADQRRVNATAQALAEVQSSARRLADRIVVALDARRGDRKITLPRP
jgi:hypothetical protein